MPTLVLFASKSCFSVVRCDAVDDGVGGKWMWVKEGGREKEATMVRKGGRKSVLLVPQQNHQN